MGAKVRIYLDIVSGMFKKAIRIWMSGHGGLLGSPAALLASVVLIAAIGLAWPLLSAKSVSMAGPAPVDIASERRAAPLDLKASFLREPIKEHGTYTFGANDNFTLVLRLLNASPETILDVINKTGKKCELNRISKGQKMDFEIVEGQGLARFSFPCSSTEVLHVKLNQGQAQTEIEEIPHKLKEKAYACVVRKDSTIIGSASEVGISEGQVMEIAHIFRSVIDFNNDVHPGDQLKVVANEIQDLNGNTLSPGDIVAVEIILGKKEYWAIKFSGPDGEGYFDKKGFGLVKTFLRSPLPYLSISSGFTIRRFHPILGKVRPHLGVDFRAPIGTPVRASASGRVVFAGWLGGYGRVIKIQHGNLMTLYAHLSKISVRKGQYVRQGHLIGEVGTSGLSTGPHLHYGMYRNGTAIDPMTVKMDTAAVVKSESFIELRDRVVKLIENARPSNGQN